MATEKSEKKEVLLEEQMKGMSFEEMLKRLEALIDRMENGALPLEQSLAAFDEGMCLIRVAREKLDVYRAKIEETVTEGK